MNKDEKNGYPLKIVEKTKESIISIIVAPITTSE